ncbi:cysteine proteinase [Dacryopinax primogenitus]|uniref:ubiquitinyl hydrolase 1 n=1 Tax=Dacryopinax primogenitus (strain DJM 731) TaxID=1858805 RepID=M5GBI5_DACPD|nr:cysteine proteinase [Dacryopinax primogenitus]EJU06324.1 cysteine proteinase [Dacryopinax primogenitus]
MDSVVLPSTPLSSHLKEFKRMGDVLKENPPIRFVLYEKEAKSTNLTEKLVACNLPPPADRIGHTHTDEALIAQHPSTKSMITSKDAASKGDVTVRVGEEFAVKRSAPSDIPEPKPGLGIDVTSVKNNTDVRDPVDKVPTARQDLPVTADKTMLRQYDVVKAETSPCQTWDINSRGLKMGWEKYPPPACGLSNGENCCYMNSVLQTLFWCPPFAQALLAEPDSDCCLHNRIKVTAPKEETPYCIFCSAVNLIKRFHTAGRVRDLAADVTKYNTTASEVFGYMDLIMKLKRLREVYEQQDAHEFYSQFIDKLDQAVSDNPTAESKTPTFVDRIFGFKTRQRIQCKHCMKCSDKVDKQRDLPLDIADMAGMTRFKSIFTSLNDQFSKPETFEDDNAYHCENCNAKRSAVKTFKILEAPQVLTLYLKRFAVGSEPGDKFEHHVSYPPKLDLAPYMVEDGSSKLIAPVWYRLASVIIHDSNTTQEGHYFAAVQTLRYDKPVWTACNDEYVRGINKATDQRDAYMLFYIREDEAPTYPESPLKIEVPQNSASVRARAEARVSRIWNIVSRTGKRFAIYENDDEDDLRDGRFKRPRLDGRYPSSPIGKSPSLLRNVKVNVSLPQGPGPRKSWVNMMGSRSLGNSTITGLKVTGSVKAADGATSRPLKIREQMQPNKRRLDVEANANGKRTSDDDDIGSPVKRRQTGRLSLGGDPVPSKAMKTVTRSPASAKIGGMGVSNSLKTREQIRPNNKRDAGHELNGNGKRMSDVPNSGSPFKRARSAEGFAGEEPAFSVNRQRTPIRDYPQRAFPQPQHIFPQRA